MESILTIIFFGLAVVSLAMWLDSRSMVRMPSLQTMRLASQTDSADNKILS